MIFSHEEIALWSPAQLVSVLAGRGATPSLRTLRKREDFPQWSTEGSKCMEFWRQHPRVQVPNLEPLTCASCGAPTWMLGPNREAVCHGCEHMYLNTWIAKEVAHV